MKGKYLIICVFTFSSCITIQKTKIGTNINNSSLGFSKDRLINIGALDDDWRNKSTLDLTLVNYAEDKIVNLHWGDTINTNDSVFFYGFMTDLQKKNKAKINVWLSLKELMNFSLNEVDFKEQSVLFKYTTSDKAQISADSLNNYFKENSPFRIESIEELALSNRVFKIYSEKIIDRSNRNAEFYASTDPVPLLLLAISAGIALYASYHKIDNKCADACYMIHGKKSEISLDLANMKFNCLCDGSLIKY